ncbi:MAG: hypothetical protein CMP75_01230 [Flavobacteriales bacterium]|nr:hypothetical protein [Flavobacteriales bacterium]|tara:strand:+ start:310 stop:1206 length:897 start_codon:yes stop_codon:yes gene_type:complete
MSYTPQNTTAITQVWMLRFFIFIIPMSAFSQKKLFMAYEDSLMRISSTILQGANDNERQAANEKFLELWEPVLDEAKSMKYPFDSLSTVAILTSDDNKVRFINWVIPQDNGTYRYEAIVQYYNYQNKYNVAYLEAIEDELREPEKMKLQNNQWIGALYYQLETIKRGKRKYYVLLGWDGNDDRSNKKIADVLTISRDLTFGAPIFKIGKKPQNRFIIEYKEDASASMKYHTKEERILFTHLIPLSEGVKGLYDFYVPDGSVDALNLRNGKFIFEENVETIEQINIPAKKKLGNGLFPK